MRKIYQVMAALALSLLIVGPVLADVTVTARATSYDPAVVFIQPGETVVWTNMAGHDSVTIDGLVPDGASSWNIPMGQNGSATLDVEGVYVYKCTPHYAMGMAGVVVVGEPKNFEQIKADATGMARRVLNQAESAMKDKDML